MSVRETGLSRILVRRGGYVLLEAEALRQAAPR